MPYKNSHSRKAKASQKHRAAHWYTNHRDASSAYCAMWRKQHPDWGFNYRLKIKIAVLTHYGRDGQLLCNWVGCDVTDVDMLSLDHMNDDGAKHRQRVGMSTVYADIIKHGYPDGFQTLCHNHQWKKEILRRRGKSNE